MRMFLIVLAALMAATQASAFGGSFESTPEPPSGPTSSAPVDDGFGGSFDGSIDDAPTPPPPSSSGSGLGGSFDDVDAAPPQTTEPEPDPVSQQNPQVPDAVFQIEAADFGVAPTDRLRQSPMHAPTPLGIPGGAMVSTQGLIDALLSDMELVVIDVLGGDYTIGGAYVAPALATPGTFDDATQQQAAIWLRQITQGNRDIPIVVFCSDPECWLSYNASLRTIAAGYRSVYWYRGGLYAWELAGLPLEPAPF